MQDTDLSNMTPQEAREYVLAFITTLKQTAQQRARADVDLETWRARQKLAEEKGAADLAAKAASMLGELEAKRATLQAEESELEGTIGVLKQNLRKLEAMGTRLVDTDLLQAELDMLVGEEAKAEHATNDALKGFQAQSALDELKKKLGSGQGG
jgi:phage shock protein A